MTDWYENKPHKKVEKKTFPTKHWILGKLKVQGGLLVLVWCQVHSLHCRLPCSRSRSHSRSRMEEYQSNFSACHHHSTTRCSTVCSRYRCSEVSRLSSTPPEPPDDCRLFWFRLFLWFLDRHPMGVSNSSRPRI